MNSGALVARGRKRVLVEHDGLEGPEGEEDEGEAEQDLPLCRKSARREVLGDVVLRILECVHRLGQPPL